MGKVIKRILIVIIVIVLIAFIGALIAIPMVTINQMANGHYAEEQYNPADYGVEAQRINLTPKDDETLSLAAWRVKAENTKGTVIILSGIQNPSVTAFFGYARMLAADGWDSLLVEMRARGESTGDKIGFGLTEWHDVVAGIDYLETDSAVAEKPIVIMGTSMGAGTALIAAGEDSRVDGVISISAFSSFADSYVEMMSSMLPKWFATMERPFVNLAIGINYGFSSIGRAPIKELKKIGDKPILLMHSTGDTQVPYANFERLQKEAEKLHMSNVSVFTREGDYHFICPDDEFDKPESYPEFQNAVLQFLDHNFA